MKKSTKVQSEAQTDAIREHFDEHQDVLIDDFWYAHYSSLEIEEYHMRLIEEDKLVFVNN